MIEMELERLLKAARADFELKQRILATKDSEEPVAEFCKLAQSLGYNITLGELLASGLDNNDAKLRSVNGGGVNPIEGWDDTYEQFFMTLEWT